MNNNQQQQNKNQELGALWKKKSKQGVSFLSGYVKVDDLGIEKEIKVVVFANNNKSNEKAPDYRIYISKPLDVEQKDSTAKTTVASTTKKTKVVQQKQEEVVEEELL